MTTRTLDLRALLQSVITYGSASSATLSAVFLFHILAGRYLGVEVYGYFSFVLALTALFLPILDPGLYYLTIRDVARDKSLAPKYFAHTLSWKLACSPIYIGAICFGAYWVSGSIASLQVAAMLSVGGVLHSLKEAFRSTLVALEKFRLDAISLSIERISLLLMGGALLLNDFGIVALSMGYALIRALDLIAIRLFVGRSVSIRIGRDPQVLKAMLKTALPIGAFYITLNIYSYIDTVMLSWLRGNEEVGWYSAAYRLYEGPVLIPSIVATVFMPRLSRLFVENREQFAIVVKQGILWVAIAALGITTVGLAAAEWILSLSYGPEFTPSTGALRILLSGLLFVFILHFLQTVLIAVDYQRFIFFIALGGLASNVAVNLVLIPVWGFYGAAVATVAVEGLVFIALSTCVWRLLKTGRA